MSDYAQGLYESYGLRQARDHGQDVSGAELILFLRDRFVDDARMAKELPKYPANVDCGLAMRIDQVSERLLNVIGANRMILNEIHQHLPLSLREDGSRQRMIRAMALPYTRHPDFKEAWLPL